MDDFTAVAALADPVRRRLYRYVAAQQDAVGREQAAEGAGVPLHTARFHLEKLVDEGLLDTEYRRLSGPRRAGGRAARQALPAHRGGGRRCSCPSAATTWSARCWRGRSRGRWRGSRSTGRSPARPAAAAAPAARRTTAGGSDLERAAGLLADEGFEPSVDDGVLSPAQLPVRRARPRADRAGVRGQPRLRRAVRSRGSGCDGWRRGWSRRPTTAASGSRGASRADRPFAFSQRHNGSGRVAP